MNLEAGVADFATVPVHAIDGDRASLCETVGAGQLAQLDHYHWSDIEVEDRCPLCAEILGAAGPDHS